MSLLAWGALVCATALSSQAPMRPIDEFRLNLKNGGEFVPGELLLRFDSAVEKTRAHYLVQKQGCQVDHQFGHRPLYLIECPESVNTEQWILRFSDIEEIPWVEASFYDDELEATPNDLAAQQWYHRNQGQAIDGVAGTMGADMRSEAAWDVVTGQAARKVAIIDVGVYPEHVELRNNLWRNPGETCGNGRDDDNNGYIDDCAGWDVGDSDANPTPLTMPERRSDGSACLRWHATAIAGLVGAEGNNNIPLVGTAWDISIINIKRHRDSSCRSTTTRTAEAVTYAMDQGADAIGMSFNSSSRSSTLERALQEAEIRGTISVMSAGNSGANTNSATRYPNNYQLSQKLIVTASNNRDQLASRSNYGSSKVHMAAPGTFVVTTGISANNAYTAGDGTSMSVGFVLGAITLVKQAYPQLSTAQARNAVLNGGRDLANLNCSQTSRCVISGKRLDLLGALGEASQSYLPSFDLPSLGFSEMGDGDGTLEPGESAALAMTIANQGTGPAYAAWAQLSLTSNSPFLTITRDTAQLGTINAGAQIQHPPAQAPTFRLSPQCNQDFSADFELVIADRMGNGVRYTFSDTFTCPPMSTPDAGVPDSGTTAADTGVTADVGQAQADASTTADTGGSQNTDAQVNDTGSQAPADAGVAEDMGSSQGKPDSGENPDPGPGPGRGNEGCSHTQSPSQQVPFGLLLLPLFALMLRRKRLA